jgi:hypothetical protein
MKKHKPKKLENKDIKKSESIPGILNKLILKGKFRKNSQATGHGFGIAVDNVVAFLLLLVDGEPVKSLGLH